MVTEKLPSLLMNELKNAIQGMDVEADHAEGGVVSSTIVRLFREYVINSSQIEMSPQADYR